MTGQDKERLRKPDGNNLSENALGELFVSDETHESLDDCLDQALMESDDLFSITNLVRGLPQPKSDSNNSDLKPYVYARFNSRMGKAKPITLKCLLDTGASGSLVDKRHAKKLRLKDLKGKRTVWTTPNGNLSTTTKCQATFMLPEFHHDRVIEWDLHVSQNLGAYDMIIGRDILSDLGFKFDFSSNTVEWDGVSIPLKPNDATEQEAYHVPDPDKVEDATDRLKKILDAKYVPADLRKVADNCEQLTPQQKDALHDRLHQYRDLFDGTLGKWKMDDYDVELLPDAKPYHAKAYPIPKVHLETLKLEVARLCEQGVLRQVNRSEWAAPTFIIPKKDGSVRFISDFRELNKRIKRKPFPIPKIQDMLLNLEGFQWATSLDLNMGYYHIELTPASKRLCTIVLPWGKYEYQRLPMGLCNSPDIFQEKMGNLFQDLEYVRAYIDDLLVLTKGSYEEHLDSIGEVLGRLRAAGLKVNANKSFFARGELEYLGYWITREGIQPVDKKVDAITKIDAPKNKKELRRFIGLVNYYRDMWVRRSHVLAPLASLTSKTTKWKWGPKEQEAFDTMKKIIAKETLLAYPDFNDEFVIHTDASHTQLGAVISQKGKPIAFYSRKLKPEQTRYTTTERELLSIVETLKEFRNILLGQKIVVHTDHKNLTCKNFNTERVMRWRLILEEYGPELKYIKGEHNVVADALSRLGMRRETADTDSQPSPTSVVGGENANYSLYLADAYAAGDEDFPTDFPLSYPEIQRKQESDAAIKKLLRDHADSYKKETFRRGTKVYTLVTKDGKIVLPKALQKKAVEWYHQVLMHPGETRTELTMGQHYTWKGMRKTVQDVCQRCQACQLNKPKLRKLGHLPPKIPTEIPWDTLCIDLIGPYTIGDEEKKTHATLHCLTMIDPVTGWFEIAEIPSKRADDVANVLEMTWFTRYPWPVTVILDRGKEFRAEVENCLKNDYGIRRNFITTRNPQANSMVERAHQTIHNLIASQGIRTREDLPDESWKGILSAVGFAMRATIHTTTRATPTQLVFNRDAIHNVRFEADWQYIKERRQKLIRQNNERENARRTPHTYNVNDTVMIEQYQHRKYGTPRYKGPYTIDRVNDNGTVRLRLATANGGTVYQTWNIRNIHPYKA